MIKLEGKSYEYYPDGSLSMIKTYENDYLVDQKKQ
jgi:antitoxin component YwqK of YwqJK toxin-antitoxin module